jgi:hypothetical protein
MAHGDTKGAPCDFDGDGDNDDHWSMVTICHIPPGNPANEHTITVGAPATPAHLAHGDYLGPCGDDPPDPVCGDGVIDEGEECDPPGRINDDFVCNEICMEEFDPLVN